MTESTKDENKATRETATDPNEKVANKAAETGNDTPKLQSSKSDNPSPQKNPRSTAAKANAKREAKSGVKTQDTNGTGQGTASAQNSYDEPDPIKVDVKKDEPLVQDITGRTADADPGRVSLEGVGVYDPDDPDDIPYAVVSVPDDISSLGDFCLKYGYSFAEVAGLNGNQDGVRRGQSIRVPKAKKPISLEIPDDSAEDLNEAGVYPKPSKRK